MTDTDTWNEHDRYGGVDPEDLWLDEVAEVVEVCGVGLEALGSGDSDATLRFLKGCAVVIARRADPTASMDNIGRRVKLGDLMAGLGMGTGSDGSGGDDEDPEA